jgi:hypothetical protein
MMNKELQLIFSGVGYIMDFFLKPDSASCIQRGKEVTICDLLAK